MHHPIRKYFPQRCNDKVKNVLARKSRFELDIDLMGARGRFVRKKKLLNYLLLLLFLSCIPLIKKGQSRKMKKHIKK